MGLGVVGAGDRNWRAPVCGDHLLLLFFLVFLVFYNYILHHDMTGRWYISTNIFSCLFLPKSSQKLPRFDHFC